MGFYEFNDFGYYALIYAKSEQEATKHYEKEVEEIAEENGLPDKLSWKEAKEKVVKCCNNEKEKQEAMAEWNIMIAKGEPFVILIDGSLI